MLRTSAQERRIRRHIRNLDDPDDGVSSRAEAYLIRHYGVRALDELLAACGHPNPVVRFRAAWALGHTGDPRVYEPLLRLTDDPDERVRYDATVALGVLGDPRAIEPLVAIWFENDESRPAAMALEGIGLKALPAVEEGLGRGNAEVRCSAVRVLGCWAQDSHDARCVELLRESLNDPDAVVRADAGFLLGEIGLSSLLEPRPGMRDA